MSIELDRWKELGAELIDQIYDSLQDYGNMEILALMGLMFQPGCPSEYREVASRLIPDGERGHVVIECLLKLGVICGRESVVRYYQNL